MNPALDFEKLVRSEVERVVNAGVPPVLVAGLLQWIAADLHDMCTRRPANESQIIQTKGN